jgi:hypothetical protein
MPPTAEAAPKPEEKTAEQIAAEVAKNAPAPQETINEFFDAVVGKPEPKPEAEKPAAKPTKPAAAKPAPKTAPKKPSAKPTPALAAAPAVDVTELATAVGKSVAAEVLAARQPEKPVIGDDLAGLTEEERERIPVLEKMELMLPNRYKGLKDKFIANSKAINEYATKWELENPGKVYDPEDAEHNDFYKKHNLEWNDADETRAAAKLIAEQEVAAVTKSTQDELETLRAKDRAREQAPAILTESRTADKKVWDTIGGDFAKVIKADGTIDTEAVKQIEESDPVAAEIAFPQVANLNAHFQELIRLERGLTRLDKANPMHNFILKFAVAQENAILALPKDKQADATGKKYAKSVDFQNMTPDQRSKHWTLGAAELNRMMAAEFGAGIKKQIDVEKARIERLSAKMGFVKGDKPKPSGAAPKEEAAPEPEEEVESPETTPVPTGRPGQAPPDGALKDTTGGFFKMGW